MNDIVKLKGVSFIELLIVILVLAILGVIAASVYSTFAREGRRSDGINALLAIQLAEERYRANNATYGSLAQAYGGATTSPQGYYNLAISGTSATGYTATATGTGSQTSDVQGTTSCTTLTLTVSNTTVTTTPAACWPS